MANPLISGVFAGLTNVNVRGVQDTITDSVDQFNWELAWKKFKMENPDYKVNDSDIPTLCKELSKNQVDVLFNNAVNNAKYEVARIISEKAKPHLSKLVKGTKDLLVAGKDFVVAGKEALGDAASAVKGGITKVADVGKQVIGALASRGQEFGDALMKKKKINITLSSFEIFMLAQMGIFKAEGINTYRHISMGPMKNVQVYKVLYYIYSKNEPLLFVLYELYKKTKQEAFQKKLRDYEEKKEAYMKEVAKYEQEQRNAQEKYNRNMENYGEKLDNYKKCIDNPFIPRKVCDKEFKPHVPVLQTRKSPKKLSEATPILSNVGVNSGPKKSEKVKELSAAIKQNSAGASQRRNHMSTRRRRS